MQFSHTQDTISIWPIDGTQTATTTPGQSKAGSNGKEWVLHIFQDFMIGFGLLWFYGVSPSLVI